MAVGATGRRAGLDRVHWHMVARLAAGAGHARFWYFRRPAYRSRNGGGWIFFGAAMNPFAMNPFAMTPETLILLLGRLRPLPACWSPVKPERRATGQYTRRTGRAYRAIYRALRHCPFC